MGVSIGQVLRQPAVRHPERIALVDLGAGSPGDRRVFDYGALDDGARRVAAHLAAAGVSEGDAVALMAVNSAEFVMAWFGIVYLGAAVVPVPILSAPPEVAWRTERSGCRLLLADAERRPTAEAADAAPVMELSEACAHEAALALPVDTDPSAPAMILYTSGTTGKARGAVLTHAALTAHTATLVHHTLGHGPEDVLFGVLPLTHSFGCRMVMLAGFFAGARIVLMPRFHAAESLAALRDEGVTWLPAVPTMFAAWAQREADLAPAHLRWCLSAGAPLADDVALRAEAVLGAEVRQGYGMTEATFSTVNAPPDDRVLGSVGRPVWGVEVRVVDDGGGDVPAGETGEVVIRGNNVMAGYLDDPEGTDRALAGGWMHSGDVGRFDEAGRLYVVDRIKDLILRGGHNVYPSEVEEALVDHPEIAEAVVVGRPDDYYGEEVVAVVVPVADSELTPDSVVAWARERVARTHYPREVAVVARLPVGSSGKVLRREIRRQVLAGELPVVRPGR